MTATFDVINRSEEADYQYPTIRLRTDAAWLDIVPEELPFYGVEAGGTLEAFFTLTANDAAAMGATAEVHMEVTRLNCETDAMIDCPTFTPDSFTVGIEVPID